MLKFSVKLGLITVLALAPIIILAVNLDTPTLSYPTAKDSPVWKGEIRFIWAGSEANFYQYQINLEDGTSRGDIIRGTSKTIQDLPLGNHSWAVRACQDSESKNCGSWSKTESFQIVSAPEELLGGLVPCGRQYDNPETKYINEAKPCQFSDLFVLLKLVLDFVLWKLGLIVIVLLTVLAGLVSYFSFGGPGTIVKVKSILKSAVTGYIIILLAWLATNLILRLLGYAMGDWWII